MKGSNNEQAMNTPEQHLLSLLKSGDMLRFVLQREADHPFSFSFEGAEAEGGNGALAERIGLVIASLRNRGMRFDPGGTPEKPKPARRSKKRAPKASKPKAASNRMVELVPARVDFLGTDVHVRGFSSAAENVSPARQGGGGLVLPALDAGSGMNLFDSLAEAAAQVPGLGRIEMEFERFDLPRDSAPLLLNALDFHRMLFPPGVEITTPPIRFLALWLVHRSGWKIRARAFLKKGTRLPAVQLEILGREIFGGDCLVEAPAHQDDHGTGLLDLSGCYPRGWPFPPFFHAEERGGFVAMERLHNQVLPQLPRKGFHIGDADGVPVLLPVESRDRHTYIVGATGTGKSTLLARMIKDDMKRGEGVILLDPHGDLFDESLAAVPANRKKDLIIINPLSKQKPPGINFLDVSHSLRPDWRLRFMIGELLQFFDGVWDLRNVGGPMFEMYFRNTILLLGDQGVREHACHSLLSFAAVLSDTEFRTHQLKHCRNQEVKHFWEKIAERTGGDASLANIAPYIVSKMDLLTQSSFIRHMIGSPKDELRIGEKMNRKAILLCNLSKGTLGAHESRLLGAILIAHIFAAGLERGMQRKATRKPVNIYIDEFQNFVSDNVASMLSEARKFGLRLTLANQNLTQLSASNGKQDLLETVLGNVGNVILFRLGVPDAARLQLFLEPFTRKEAQDLPNYHAITRILTSDGPVPPVILKTLPS